MRPSVAFLFSCATFALTVAACSGARSGADLPALPSEVGMRFQVSDVPSGVRSIAVSHGGRKIAFDLNGSAGSFTVAAWPGKRQRFDISVYDGRFGTGRRLSAATIVADVDARTVVPLTLSTVVKAVAVFIGTTDGSIPAGTPTTAPLIVMATNASGKTIVGTYNTPITLADPDTSGITTLSVNGGGAATSIAVESSSDFPELSYNGSNITKATITPTANGATKLSAATLYPVPRTLAYYAIPGVNGGPALPVDVASGADGAVWYTVAAGLGVGKMTTDGTPTVFVYGQPPAPPRGITAIAGAPKGGSAAVWFNTNSTVGTIDTNGHAVVYTPQQGYVCGGHAWSFSGYTRLISDGSTGFWIPANCNNRRDALLHVDANGNFQYFSQVPGFQSSSYAVRGKDGNIYVAGIAPSSYGFAVLQAVVKGTTIVSKAVAVAPSTYGMRGAIGFTQSGDGDFWASNCSTGNASLLVRVHPATPFASSAFASFPTPQGDAYACDMVTTPDGYPWAFDGEYPIAMQIVPAPYPAAPDVNSIAVSNGNGLFGFLANGAIGPDGNLWIVNAATSTANGVFSGDLIKEAY